MDYKAVKFAEKKLRDEKLLPEKFVDSEHELYEFGDYMSNGYRMVDCEYHVMSSRGAMLIARISMCFAHHGIHTYGVLVTPKTLPWHYAKMAECTGAWLPGADRSETDAVVEMVVELFRSANWNVEV